MKQKMRGFFDCCLMLALLWGVSFLNGSWLYWGQIISWILLGGFGVFLLIMFVQGKRQHLLIILWLLLLMGSSPVVADFTTCIGLKGAELDVCMYRELGAESQSIICGEQNTWGRQKYTEIERKRRGQIAGRASKLIDLYEALTPTMRNSVSDQVYKCSKTYIDGYHKWLGAQSGSATMNVNTVPLIIVNSQLHCWTCDIVLIFIVIMEHLVINSLVALSSIALMMLGVILAFWLVFRVWRLTLDLEKSSKTFFRDVLKQLGIAMLAGMLLVNLSTRNNYRGSMLQGLFQVTIMPVVDTVLFVGDIFSQGVLPTSTLFEMIRSQINPSVMPEVLRNSYCSLDGDVEESINARIAYFFGIADAGLDVGSGENAGYYVRRDDLVNTNRVFSGEVIQGLLCLTQRIYNQIMPVTAIGQVIVADQVEKFANLFNLKKWADELIERVTGKKDKLDNIPSLRKLFFGLIIYIPCLLLTWMIAFEVLDIFIRMMFVFVLIPIWVTCAVFPVTRFYAKQTLKMFFSLMIDFLAVIFGVGVMVAITQRFFPDGLQSELVCRIFDVVTNPKLTQGNRCIPPAGGLQSLGSKILGKSNDAYADNLYDAITGKGYGLKFVLAILAMYYFGKKIFSSAREAFRSLLGATTGVSIGGQMFGKAVMEAQETTRRGIGYTLTAIPFIGPIAGGVVNFVGKIADSVGAGIAKPFNALADLTAKGINAVGDTSAQAVDKAGTAVGRGINHGGSWLVQTGLSVCPAFFGLGCLVGIPMMIAGAAMLALGTTIIVSAKIIALVAKLVSRVTGMLVRAVTKGVLKGIGKSFKALGRNVNSSIRQFFYFQGNTADKKRDARDAKNRKKKNKKYYGH